ncbi:hypothetical protein L596_016328 [Steinernema carpocapsae]|uniref:K Homology domain-containing protein n=1 Tax=Steinernema carpocapsae TaxID=34508 RepID=A0A4U5NHN4_STECR|nr:hypothetical protein L596_016328 [Steinernema carpocapsae]
MSVRTCDANRRAPFQTRLPPRRRRFSSHHTVDPKKWWMTNFPAFAVCCHTDSTSHPTTMPAVSAKTKFDLTAAADLLTRSEDCSTSCSSLEFDNDFARRRSARLYSGQSRTSTSVREHSVEYLADLLKEQKQLQVFPGCFLNIERLVNDEINRVRSVLFKCDFANGGKKKLPEPVGQVALFTEKVYIPIKEFPDYNFVGRILGPRGMTAKELEQETGCKIMVRGKGSVRDSKKEEMNRGRRNWEHLEDELHVLIHCEDTPNRAKIQLSDAVAKVKEILVPAPEGSDELKRKQLVELALINGTYRPTSQRYAISPHLVGPISLFSPVRATAPALVSPTVTPLSPLHATTPMFSQGYPSSPFFKSASPTVDYNMNLMMNQLGLNA